MKHLQDIIPIGLFICAQSAYDNLAPAKSIEWTIFYFVAQHFSWLLMCYILGKRYNIKKRIPFIILGLGYTAHIIILLSKLGMSDYDKFMLSINNYEANLLLTLFMIVLIIISFQIIPKLRWRK